MREPRPGDTRTHTNLVMASSFVFELLFPAFLFLCSDVFPRFAGYPLLSYLLRGLVGGGRVSKKHVGHLYLYLYLYLYILGFFFYVLVDGVGEGDKRRVECSFVLYLSVLMEASAVCVRVMFGGDLEKSPPEVESW